MTPHSVLFSSPCSVCDVANEQQLAVCAVREGRCWVPVSCHSPYVFYCHSPYLVDLASVPPTQLIIAQGDGLTRVQPAPAVSTQQCCCVLARIKTLSQDGGVTATADCCKASEGYG
ncbi:hypothetical protein HaLaN_01514, partial [Haematococcus lacustris]